MVNVLAESPPPPMQSLAQVCIGSNFMFFEGECFLRSDIVWPEPERIDDGPFRGIIDSISGPKLLCGSMATDSC